MDTNLNKAWAYLLSLKNLPDWGGNSDELRQDKREIYRKYLRSPKWQALRHQRLLRDRRQCVRCGSGQRLHVHHLFYRQDLSATRIEDLVTLCERCHKLEHGLKKPTFFIEPCLNKDNYTRLTFMGYRQLHESFVLNLIFGCPDKNCPDQCLFVGVTCNAQDTNCANSILYKMGFLPDLDKAIEIIDPDNEFGYRFNYDKLKAQASLFLDVSRGLVFKAFTSREEYTNRWRIHLSTLEPLSKKGIHIRDYEHTEGEIPSNSVVHPV